MLSKSGNIVDVESKEIIGKHNGLGQYTIGQRRGLDIGGASGRTYVVGKNLSENILYVSIGDDNKYLKSDSCIIENVSFNISDRPLNCMAKFRYRGLEYPVTLEYLDNNMIRVRYNDIKAVTPGQTCVLYINDQCIGSGIIKTVCQNDEKIWYIL